MLRRKFMKWMGLAAAVPVAAKAVEVDTVVVPSEELLPYQPIPSLITESELRDVISKGRGWNEQERDPAQD